MMMAQRFLFALLALALACAGSASDSQHSLIVSGDHSEVQAAAAAADGRVFGCVRDTASAEVMAFRAEARTAAGGRVERVRHLAMTSGEYCAGAAVVMGSISDEVAVIGTCKADVCALHSFMTGDDTPQLHTHTVEQCDKLTSMSARGALLFVTCDYADGHKNIQHYLSFDVRSADNIVRVNDRPSEHTEEGYRVTANAIVTDEIVVTAAHLTKEDVVYSKIELRDFTDFHSIKQGSTKIYIQLENMAVTSIVPVGDPSKHMLLVSGMFWDTLKKEVSHDGVTGDVFTAVGASNGVVLLLQVKAEDGELSSQNAVLHWLDALQLKAAVRIEDSTAAIKALGHGGDSCGLCAEFANGDAMLGDTPLPYGQSVRTTAVAGVHVKGDKIEIETEHLDVFENTVCNAVAATDAEVVAGGSFAVAMHDQTHLLGALVSVPTAGGYVAPTVASAPSPPVPAPDAVSAPPSPPSPPMAPASAPPSPAPPAGPSPLAGVPSLPQVSDVQMPSAATMASGEESSGVQHSSEGGVIGNGPVPESSNTTTIAVTAGLLIVLVIGAVAYYLYSKYSQKAAPTPDLHRFTRMEQEMGSV